MADLDSLERELRTLRERLNRIEEEIGALRRPQRTDAPQPAAIAQPAIQTSAPLSSPTLPPPPQQAFPPAPKAPKEKFTLERTIGIRLFNLIGALALIVGIGYFLKYAIDNEWIGPTGRVVLGLLAGTGLMVWGDHFRAKLQFRLLSLGMSGAGISVLYLSLFAAFSYYSLIPQWLACVFMVMVTATSVFLSVRYNSLLIALLGLAGGFLTPALLSTGENRPVELFLYLLVLDAGMLALAFRKDWKILNVVCMASSYLWFAVWYFEVYSQEQFGIAFTFLALFFLTFAVSAITYNIIAAKKTNWADGVLILGNAVVYFPSALGLLEPYDWIHGLFALIMAFVYFGLGSAAYKRNPADRPLLFMLLAVAVTFLAIAIPLQFEGRWVAIAWATLALGLWWIGLRFRSDKAQIGSLILFIFAMFDLFVFGSSFGLYNYEHQVYSFTPVFNSRFITFLCVSIALALGVVWAKREPPPHMGMTSAGIQLFSIAAALTLLVGCSLESSSYFDAKQLNALQASIREEVQETYYEPLQDFTYARRVALSGVWVVYSMCLLGVGIHRRNAALRMMALLVFGITIFKVFLYDLAFLVGFYRIASLVGLGAVLLLVSYLYQKFRNVLG